MTKRDYEALAKIVGRTLSLADWHGVRAEVYRELYEPLVGTLAAGNERFNLTIFAEAVAKAEKEASEA